MLLLYFFLLENRDGAVNARVKLISWATERWCFAWASWNYSAVLGLDSTLVDHFARGVNHTNAVCFPVLHPCMITLLSRHVGSTI